MNRRTAATSRPWLPILLSLALLALMSVVIGAAAVVDYRDRAASPDAAVRRYFAALEAGDVASALAEIEPEGRDRWTEFVENGVFNAYRITGIAVRQPSPLARLRGAPAGPLDVTVFLDITPWVSGSQWQAAPRVPLERFDGRWYLARPPLATEQ